MPYEEATPPQHGLIIKLVCNVLNEPWTRPPMDRIASYLNSTFNLNLDAELEPMTKREASTIISSLKSA